MTTAIKRYEIWILCEDKEHYYFIRGFFSYLGVDNRKFKLVNELPDGNGSGEQFVRDKFPKALRKYARHPERKLLVVVQDVDQEDRDSVKMANTLNIAAQNYDIGSIKGSDKLLLIFPKRNIETWFEWLNSNKRDTISETRDYKQSHRNAKPGILGEQACKYYLEQKDKPDNNCVIMPSMKYACNNLDKLDKLLQSIG